MWSDKKLKVVGSQTFVHHLNLLSHLYTVAETEWGLETLQNPVSKIKKPNLPRGRDRRLDDGEEARLLAACERSESAWLAPMVRLALATAMRQGELVGLAWSQDNLASRTILLRETKNGETRTVPLSTAAVQVLQELSKEVTDSVFGIKTGRAVSHAFAKACKAADLADLHFHDLRHEATSPLFEHTDLRDIEIASITGHKTMEMLKCYAHLRFVNLAVRLG